MQIQEYSRALRLPFVSASVLPFVVASFYGGMQSENGISWFSLLFGMIAVLCTHLSANMINDYADSKTGADWGDRKYYGFFGGSKLIQEGKWSEEDYFCWAAFLGMIAFFSIGILSMLLGALEGIILYLLVLFLGWAYSFKPFQWSYHYGGEFLIFILFGPALVMGGIYLQTLQFPTWEGFWLSIPFGCLTTAILVANEIPDHVTDQQVGKRNWVSWLGVENGWKIFALLHIIAYMSIIVCVAFQYLSLYAILSFVFIPLSYKATLHLQWLFLEKEGMIQSSKMAIGIQAGLSLFLLFITLVGRGS